MNPAGLMLHVKIVGKVWKKRKILLTQQNNTRRSGLVRLGNWFGATLGDLNEYSLQECRQLLPSYAIRKRKEVKTRNDSPF